MRFLHLFYCFPIYFISQFIIFLLHLFHFLHLCDLFPIHFISSIYFSPIYFILSIYFTSTICFISSPLILFLPNVLYFFLICRISPFV